MSPDSQPESIPSTAPSASPVPPHQKPPWPFWAVAIISCLFGPLAGFLVTWQNLKRMKEQEDGKKFLIKGGLLFLLISLFPPFQSYLSGYTSPTDILVYSTTAFSPFWYYLPVGVDTLFSLAFSLSFPLWLHFSVSRKTTDIKTEFSWSIVKWGIVSFLVSLSITFLFRLPNLSSPKTPKESDTQVSSPTPTPTEFLAEITPTPPPYYIKILDNKLSSEPYSKPEEEINDCQPELFDPKTTKFRKVTVPGPDDKTRDRYLIGDDKREWDMVINGDGKIILPQPFSLTYYHFGCASTSSYIFSIEKNNERLFLLTHIETFSFSPDKTMLFLANKVKEANNKWIEKRRIINLETGNKIELPNVECTADAGVWDQGKLITYGDTDVGCPNTMKICTWNKNGQLLNQLEAFLDQFAGAKCYMESELGFLPSNKNIFYATVLGDASKNFSGCRLALQSLDQQDKNKSFIIETADFNTNHCPESIEFDLKNFGLDSTTLKYRAYEGSTWSPWKEAKAEERSIKEKTPSEQNLKTIPIPFGKYTITLPLGYGWPEIENEVYNTQGPASPECEHLVNDIPSCHYVRIKDLVYSSADKPEIIIADHYDKTITGGIAAQFPETKKLGSGNYIADFEISWKSDIYNPTKIARDQNGNPEHFYSIQGCPRKDLCISYRNNSFGDELNVWNIDKIKKFINETIITEK